MVGFAIALPTLRSTTLYALRFITPIGWINSPIHRTMKRGIFPINRASCKTLFESFPKFHLLLLKFNPYRGCPRFHLG